jgi:hypothetical protein
MSEVQQQENVQPLEGSETSENNVINESDYQEDLSSGESSEDESRKFQSMYDKAQAEVEKLQPVAKLFQDNPELVDVVRDHLSGGNGQEKEQIKLTEEEFNPWEAYTNPGSASFRLRQNEIETAVSARMKDYTSKLEQQRAVDNLQYRAQSEFNMSMDEAKEFVDFVTTPKEQLPLDTLHNVWNAKQGRRSNNNIQNVKNTQQKPKSAGIIQGGSPPKASDSDNLWNNIMGASEAGKISKGIKK